MESSRSVEYYRLPHQPITVLKTYSTALKSDHCAVNVMTFILAKSGNSR